MRTFLTFLALLLAPLAALNAADLKLAGVFTDHTVLQRGQPVPVWGWADPDEAVGLRLPAPARGPRLPRAGAPPMPPDRPMPALGEITFATAGFGRIARSAHRMMAGFGGPRIAYDPFVSAAVMAGSHEIRWRAATLPPLESQPRPV